MTIDEGELAEALERAARDCASVVPFFSSPAAYNMLARHAVHHLDDVQREFAEKRAATADPAELAPVKHPSRNPKENLR
jgi:hypothetical protein